MITISIKKSNSFSQFSYNLMIKFLPFHKLQCTCGQNGNLIKHGYYNRCVKVSGDLVDLIVLRVRCKSCKKTHSILPDCLVPYSRILLKDHLKIIHAYLNKQSFEPIMIDNLLIDESNTSYIIKSFRQNWKERLSSYGISLDNQLIIMCFKYFSRQFMQVKRTVNILFFNTHIS
jgi:hypothetical protein